MVFERHGVKYSLYMTENKMMALEVFPWFIGSVLHEYTQEENSAVRGIVVTHDGT